MTRKSVIVIGAGIAGLSTGCYARMNGYDVQIFEKHDKPGGMCTSWVRKGYTFDYCIHNLIGSSATAKAHRYWAELGALSGTEVLTFGEMVQLEDQKGNRVDIVSDVDALERRLIERAPADADLVREYVGVLRKLRKVEVMALMLDMKPLDQLSLLPKLGLFKKLGSITASQFSDKFQDEFLRRSFRYVQYGISEIPMIAHVGMFAAVLSGDGGWPQGGSLTLSRNIEKRYLELGGKIAYKSKVQKVLVENGMATGVRLIDGSEHRADVVISAADGYSTVYTMLEGRYLNDTIRSYYNEWVSKDQDFGLEVFLGVARDLEQEPHALCILLDEPIVIEGVKVPKLDVEVLSSATGVAPNGKGVIKVVFKSGYDYWKGLRDKGKEEYYAEKERIVEQVLRELEKRFPGLRGQVEAKDVITPVTTERYLGAYRGLQAWPSKVEMSTLMKEGLSTTLPGLEGFYMVGQYAQGTIGLTTVAAAGRKLVKRLCKEDGKKFQTSDAP